MGPELTITALTLGAVAFANSIRSNSAKKHVEHNILSGRCRAPLWAVLQCIDTLIHVRMPTNQYPLSRYWLELQDADYQRGSISAYLEFVEEVVRPKVLGFEVGPAKATVKKFGFIWVAEEILVNEQLEQIVSLVWKDLTPGKTSQYEELILHTIASLTRQIINRLDSTVIQTAKETPLTGPPPIESHQGKGAFKSSPPPGNFAVIPPATPLRSSLGGRRQSNKIAFAEMSRKAQHEPASERTKRLVEWPSPADFHEAIQNPSSCFADKFLRNGEADSDSMGMPRVASGAFASVYRMRCIDKNRAVRCFLHPIKDQQLRYQALGRHINTDELPWTVEFFYLSQGISVANKWYPILMMDWVEGTPLNSHVASLCDNLNVHGIEDLRGEFMEMSAGLKRAKVAHGDLQHGNILVQDGRLVLVDYDGMFVPELKNEISNELGHANYQHPGRTEQNFDGTIDHFSTWVIDTALLCLREDPSLWKYCYEDGESLLFHRPDFIRPDSSALLKHLTGHSSSIVRTRAREFKQLLELTIDAIPPLLAIEPEEDYENDADAPASETAAATWERRLPAGFDEELVQPKPPGRRRSQGSENMLSNNKHDTSKSVGSDAPSSNLGADDSANTKPREPKPPRSRNLPDWLDDIE